MGFKNKGEELYEALYAAVRRYSAKTRRIKQFKKITNQKTLTSAQKAEVAAFYAPYKKPNLVFHNFFTEKTGVFHANYIPQDLYVGYIDPYFNDIKAAKYLDNKCYFDALFHRIPQPHLVLKRVNKMWLDNECHPVSEQEMKAIILREENGMFVKEAQTSSGGHGVTFVESDENAPKKVLEAAAAIPTDIVIQRPIVQHAELAKMNDSSVNTLRLYSVLSKAGTAKIYSAVLRMGNAGSKVDNYAAGGISCGIDESGKLRKYGYNKKGMQVCAHPTSNITFEGYEVPSYDRAVELVKTAHPLMPHFRSVSWDIAITADGTPVLIEANLCRGGIDLLQLNNGPLFGEDTVSILNEVFGNKR